VAAGAGARAKKFQVMKPKFFSTAEKFREWLEKNHATADELLVGFHKKSSGKQSITYPEALDEALCFGWIDGVRRRLDDTSYTTRFTPRRPKSIWSLINIKHVERLKKEGRMRPAGLAAYKSLDPKRVGIYSFENAPKELAAEYEKEFRKNKTAWDYFQSYPPYLKKTVSYWVMSAKKEETRLGRLRYLIESSARRKRVGVLPKSKA
jgi:uncharacterized protein YdeI (YjbR/CyaY-like superfamily)